MKDSHRRRCTSAKAQPGLAFNRNGEALRRVVDNLGPTVAEIPQRSEPKLSNRRSSLHYASVHCLNEGRVSQQLSVGSERPGAFTCTCHKLFGRVRLFSHGLCYSSWWRIVVSPKEDVAATANKIFYHGNYWETNLVAHRLFIDTIA